MTKTFVLLFKDTLQIKTYTSLVAIYEDNTPEVLGIALSTLQRRDFKEDMYENAKVRIELSITRTKNDVIRSKEQFL